MITIRYEISQTAARNEFIKNGVYYGSSNYGRWLEISVEPSELSKEDRRLIWSSCKDSGCGVFTYESHYVHKVCESIEDFLDALRD